MIKIVLSLMMLTSAGVYNSQAQITLNSTDVLGMGDQIELAKDTLPGAITIGPSGASQTWDFSRFSEDQIDTITFQDPISLPGSVDFPLSNLGMIQSVDDSAWYFLTKNTSMLASDGVHEVEDGIETSISFTYTVITFPSTMGTTYNSSGNGELETFYVGQLGIDSLKITKTITQISEIDAWGDVITPLGTFASLRQLVQENHIDTTWIYQSNTWSIMDAATALTFGIDPIEYDTTRTATWWSNDPAAKYSIVKMNYEVNGTVSEIEWLKATPTAVSVNQFVNIEDKVYLYPNPAKNNITISTQLTNNDNIKIFDVTGKLIIAERFNSNKITLSVSDFNNGLYFYNIIDVNGNVIYSNKFVVAK